jgi:hypothetical protein
VGGTRVTTPSGQGWQVRRLWAPRLHAFGMTGRLRRGARASRQAAGETAGEADPGFAVDVLEGGGIAIAIAAAFVVLAIVAPLIGVVVDLILAILLTALGVAGRLLFRRPWVVEAASDTGDRHRWQVVGWRASRELLARWRASRELLADVANALAHGHVLPATGVVGGVASAAP